MSYGWSNDFLQKDFLKAWKRRLIGYTASAAAFWNRVPEAIRSQIVDLRWINPSSARGKLAERFTDEEKYFVSEASVYRLLKAHDLITSPAYIVIKAAEEFRTRPPRPTSSGRPTSPISKSREGVGIISPPCWTTSRASLSPENSVRP